MKVHGQTIMAMTSGCKIYTHKCYVILEWPLMLHFKHRICCPQFVQHALRKNSARESALKTKFHEQVPLKCNFAN